MKKAKTLPQAVGQTTALHLTQRSANHKQGSVHHAHKTSQGLPNRAKDVLAVTANAWQLPLRTTCKVMYTN